MNLSLLIFLIALVSFASCTESDNIDKIETDDSSDEITWLNRYLLFFFSPDGYKILNNIERPSPRSYHLNLPSIQPTGFVFNYEEFCEFVNEIEIDSDFDFGADEGLDDDNDEQDTLTLTVTQYDQTTKSTVSNLAVALFEAAIWDSNSHRVHTLLHTHWDTKLSRLEKARLFRLSLKILSRNPRNEQVHSIITALFNRNFYTPRPAECLFADVFQNQQLVSIFLDRDPDFFKREKTCNYVKQALSRSDYDAAENALNAGCNPKIVVNGRNALDQILADMKCEEILAHSAKKSPTSSPQRRYLASEIAECKRKELRRKALITSLTKVHFVRETASYANFISCCLEGRPEYALTLLKTGKIEPTNTENSSKFHSILEAALYTRHLQLIKAAYNWHFNRLTEDLLDRCLKLIVIKSDDDDELITMLEFLQTRIISKLEYLKTI